MVQYGIEHSRYIAFFASFLPVAAFIVLYGLVAVDVSLNGTFFFLTFLTLILQIRTGWLYYRYPTGEKTYYSLVVNFRAGACGQAALIALYNPGLAVSLFFATYMFVGFLFEIHSDSSA